MEHDAGALRYLLPAGATLGDLAERITHLDEQFDRAPVAIYLKWDRSTGTLPTMHLRGPGPNRLPDGRGPTRR